MFTLSEDSPKKNPFPCPTTYRTALLHYVDIASTVKTHVLRELAEYATDAEDRQFLLNITDSTEEAKVGLTLWHSLDAFMSWCRGWEKVFNFKQLFQFVIF